MGVVLECIFISVDNQNHCVVDFLLHFDRITFSLSAGMAGFSCEADGQDKTGAAWDQILANWSSFK